jgi:hypothetical protein
MKQILSFVLIVIFAVVFSSQAQAQASLNFKFTATYQAVGNQLTNTVHSTRTATNYEQIYTFTTTNAPLNNDKLLRLLANSFNTNFPPGAALKLTTAYHFVVTVGTNIVLDPSNVLALNHSKNAVVSGKVILGTKIIPHGDILSTDSNAVVNGEASLDYDDSSLLTADGSTTHFSARGLLTSHDTSHVVNGDGSTTYTLTFSGSGSGSITNGPSHTLFILRGGFVGRPTL